jgi:hypothetical protein
MINTLFLTLSFLTAFANATPCNDGWQSSSSGSGTCSHHGGIAGGGSGYYPTYSPTYAAPTVRTTADATGWTTLEPSINRTGTLVLRFVEKHNDQMIITYMCASEEGKQIGSSILVQLLNKTGWAPIISPFVHPADPADEGNNLVVSLATVNSVSRIKSWRVADCEDCLILSKNVGDLVQSDANAERLTNDELQKFKTADYVSVTVNEDTYMISLAGSAAAIAATDATCNR